MDTLICGQCGVSFHDLHQFVDHKNNGCEDGSKPAEENPEFKQDDQKEEEEEQQFVIASADDNQEMIMDSSILILSHGDDIGQQQFQDGEVVHMEVMTDDMGYQQLVQSWPPTTTSSGTQQVVEVVNWDEHVAAQAQQQQEQQQQEHQPTEQDNYTPNRIELVPVSSTATPGGVDLQIMLNPPPKPPPSLTKSGKRRGRPKKSEQKPKPTEPVQEPVKVVKEERPEAQKGEDGKLHCPKCKRSFARQRQYNTHICGASNARSDYVDLSLKDVRIDLDLSEEEDDDEDVNALADPSVEFKFPPKDVGSDGDTPPVKRGRGRPRKTPAVASKPKGNQVTQIIFQEVQLRSEQEQAVSQIQNHIEGEGGGGQTVLIAELQDPSSLAGLSGESHVLEERDESDEHMVTQSARTVQEESSIPSETSNIVPGDSSPSSNDESKEQKSESNIRIQTVKLSDIQNMPGSGKMDTEHVGKKEDKKQGVITQLQESDLSKLEEQGVKVIKISSADISAGIPEGAVVLSDLSQKSLEEVRKTLTMQQANLNSSQKAKRTKIKVEENTDMSKIEDLPLFTNEEDKAQFDQALNVDISCVDSLFATHIISQEMNENAYPSSTRLSDTLVVFSCSQCQRVFMSLSHARHHCLIHTDLKPFRCFKCEYTTNTKGNLYNHMRRHTGQMYTCPHCSFRTHNKGHLVEHVEIHSKTQHECRLCRKKYSTTKSLANHVKRYHVNTAKGREYAQQFVKRKQQGAAMLHMCQVCNRKFKKQCDRDRHLLIHNIRGGGTSTADAENQPQQQGAALFYCDLCEYVASRRQYLQRHLLRHRIVYRCCECMRRFPSSKRLEQHPCAAVHGAENKDSEDWHSYYERCILASKYRRLEEHDDNDDDDEDDQLVHEPNPDMSINLEEAIKQQSQQLGQPAAAVEEIVTSERATDRVTFLVKPSGGGEYRVKAKAGGAAEGKDGGEEGITEESVFATYVPLSLEALKNISDSVGRFECEYCGRRFAVRAELDQHVKTHTGDKPFACDECEFRSITRENLRRHVARHHQNVHYVCQACPPLTSSSAAAEVLGGDVDQMEQQQGEGELQQQQQPSAPRSLVMFPTRSALWAHEQEVHKAGPGAGHSTTVTCLQCNSTFDNQRKLKIHLAMKHPELDQAEKKKVLVPLTRPQAGQQQGARKTVKCPFCPKVFYRANSDLQKHLWIHQGLKPFKCPLCSHACRSKNNLHAHMVRHSQDKPFLCTHCGKAYKSRTALRWHVRSHTDGKIFKCHKCPYEGSQQSHLTRHLETHNIAKKYCCQHCDFSANTVGYMKIHYTRFHKGQLYKPNTGPFGGYKQTAPDAKVYRCLSCDYLFGNLSDMKRHLRVRHHVQVEDMGPLEELDTSSSSAVLTETQQQQQLQEPMQILIREEGQDVDGAVTLQTIQDGTTPPELLNTLINIQHQQQPAQVEVGGSSTVEVEPMMIDSHVEEGGGAGEQFVIQYVTEHIVGQDDGNVGQTFTEEVHIAEDHMEIEEEGGMELEVAFDNTQEVFVTPQQSDDMNMMKLVSSGESSFQHLQPAPDEQEQHLHIAPDEHDEHLQIVSDQEHHQTAPADQEQHLEMAPADQEQHLEMAPEDQEQHLYKSPATIVQYETSSNSYPVQTEHKEPQELAQYQEEQFSEVLHVQEQVEDAGHS